VTSSYFRVLGIPVLQGRVFEAREAATGHAVAVVDERLAARLWPGQSALGRFVARYEPSANLVWHQVVGVVGAIRAPLSTGETHPVVYVPWSRRPTMQLVLIGRGRGSDAQLLASLRDLVQRADSNIGVLQARMVSQRIDERRSLRRLAAELLAFCAIGGLALAMCGLYGVLSYAVAQRRRELGVRLALGAQRRDISLMVVKEAAVVAAAGSVAGIPLALIAMQIASHYVLPIPALDVLTPGIALAAVSVVALAACYVPARRAARVDPIDVLRAL
jgi:hypothetical protein